MHKLLYFNPFVRLYSIIFMLGVCYISYKVYAKVIFLQQQRKQILNNFYDADLENNSYEKTLSKKYTERRSHARKIMKIKAIIKQVNLKQKIYNEHLYTYIVPNYIILIQVHSNVYLLRQLLDSLRTAQSINNALLIFSHDIFDPEVNKAVHSVSFAKYMQIFYPYSVQLHPNVYPGKYDDKKSCKQCKSRDAAAAQKKHHWWWQMNQVFDHLDVTRNYNKTILLLEEDNYVTVDFLLILSWLESTVSRHCSALCDMISLGAHDPDPILYEQNATIFMEMWSEKMSNIGIGFGKSTWHAIKSWSEDFCYFNDYTWDNTLKYVGSKDLGTHFYIAAIDGARVFRIDTCDDKDSSCKPEYKVNEVAAFIDLVNEGIFPWTYSTKLIRGGDYYAVQPLGAFNDVRDHDLCMYITDNCVWF